MFGLDVSSSSQIPLAVSFVEYIMTLAISDAVVQGIVFMPAEDGSMRTHATLQG